MKNIQKTAAILILGATLSTVTTFSQMEPSTPNTSVAVEDDRPNYTPLLGLLGLLGLMGMKRNHDRNRGDTTTHR